MKRSRSDFEAGQEGMDISSDEGEWVEYASQRKWWWSEADHCWYFQDPLDMQWTRYPQSIPGWRFRDGKWYMYRLPSRVQ